MAAQLGFDQLAREARQVVDAVAAGIAVNGLHDRPGKRVRVAAQVFDERTLTLAEISVHDALHAGQPLDIGKEKLLLRGMLAAVVEQQGQDALAVERPLSAGRGGLCRDGEPFLRQAAAVQAVARLEHRVAVLDLVLEGIAAERQVGRALCGAVFVLEAAVFAADVVRAVHERQPAEYTVVPVHLVLPELDVNRRERRECAAVAGLALRRLDGRLQTAAAAGIKGCAERFRVVCIEMRPEREHFLARERCAGEQAAHAEQGIRHLRLRLKGAVSVRKCLHERGQLRAGERREVDDAAADALADAGLAAGKKAALALGMRPVAVRVAERGNAARGVALDAERQRGIAAFAALVRAQIDVFIRQIGTVLPGGMLALACAAAQHGAVCLAEREMLHGRAGAERSEIRVRRQQEGHAAAVRERLGDGRLRAEKIRAGLTPCGLNDLDAAELCKEQRLSKRKLRIVCRTRGERALHQISVHLLLAALVNADRVRTAAAVCEDACAERKTERRVERPFFERQLENAALEVGFVHGDGRYGEKFRVMLFRDPCAQAAGKRLPAGKIVLRDGTFFVLGEAAGRAQGLDTAVEFKKLLRRQKHGFAAFMLDFTGKLCGFGHENASLSVCTGVTVNSRSGRRAHRRARPSPRRRSCRMYRCRGG